MVTPKGGTSTEGETLQVSVLPYRCSICPRLVMWQMSIILLNTCNLCGRNLITGLTSATSPRVDISSTCKVGQKLGVSLPLLTCSPFGVPIPATVPHRSKIPEGLMNYPVYFRPGIVQELFCPMQFPSLSLYLDLHNYIL